MIAAIQPVLDGVVNNLWRVYCGAVPVRGAASAEGMTSMADTRRLPQPVTDVWDWQLHGACREMDSAVFFHPENERGPARAGREAHAKQICRSCPVIQQCRAHSLAAREPYGVWGGMSESERDEIIRAQDRTLRVLDDHRATRGGGPSALDMICSGGTRIPPARK